MKHFCGKRIFQVGELIDKSVSVSESVIFVANILVIRILVVLHIGAPLVIVNFRYALKCINFCGFVIGLLLIHKQLAMK